MMNFCTVADSNYLLKGLAMYNSIAATYKGEFRLHWLCLDDKCYNSLVDMWQKENNNIRPYKLTDFEKTNTELAIMKRNPATMFGDAYSNYCWALTPWFIDYILNFGLNNRDTGLMYVDSDIYFFKSPQLILDAMDAKGYEGKDYSVAIHTHRFTKPYNGDLDTGWYNVGVLYFKANDLGEEIAKTWKNWMIDTQNPYYKTHGKTGDQKYLELFSQIWGQEFIFVFDEETNISHLAPWCANIEPEKETLFFHFSHFRYNLKQNAWYDSLQGEWAPAREKGIEPYYQRYFAAIKAASGQLIDKVSIIGNIRIDTNKPDRIKGLVACLRSFEFMKDYCEIIINFECPHPALKLLQAEFDEIGFNGKLYFTKQENNYGDAYTFLVNQAKYDFVLNFFEDHFCVMDNINELQGLLRDMRENEIDVMKCSFHEIENKSISKTSIPLISTSHGRYFLNNEENFNEYSKYYGCRFFIGVNFLTTKTFAKQFWGREFNSGRPHEWEISEYNPEFEHTVLIPNVPFLASIDDHHGEPGTELLKSKNKKFHEIYFNS